MVSEETLLLLVGLFSALGILLASIPVAGWFVSMLFSRRIHRKKVADIMERVSVSVERFGGDPLTNVRSCSRKAEVLEVKMISANIVVGAGWWNQFVGFWHSVIGGTITNFDDVLMLARQDTMQRLRDQAAAEGYDEVINVRLESARLAALTSGNKGTKAIEIFAYGTAVKYA